MLINNYKRTKEKINMEETKKEEVKKEETSEMKKVKKAKLGPGATVILTIVAALGIMVLIAVIYGIFQVL